MDTSSSNTVDFMENQILKTINHIKYISKKKLALFNYASNDDYHSVEYKLNELKPNGIIDDSYKIVNPMQEVMNFVTEDKVIIYSDNSEDESNDLHRTTTSPKIVAPEINTQVVNMNTTQEPQEPNINVTKGQLQSF